MNNKQWNFTLCGRNGTCCPVVSHQEDGSYTITDDHGGAVVLTQEQMQLLQHAVDHANTQLE